MTGHEWIETGTDEDVLIGECSCGAPAGGYGFTRKGWEAHLAALASQVTAQPPARPDYEPAWREINQVYDRGVNLLGSEYIGWNWVHALVDKLEKIEACLCSEDLLNWNCPVHGKPPATVPEQGTPPAPMYERGFHTGGELVESPEPAPAPASPLTPFGEELQQKSFRDGVRSLRILVLEEMDRPLQMMPHTHNPDVRAEHQGDYCWRCKIERVLDSQIEGYKVHCRPAPASPQVGETLEQENPSLEWLCHEVAHKARKEYLDSTDDPLEEEVFAKHFAEFIRTKLRAALADAAAFRKDVNISDTRQTTIIRELRAALAESDNRIAAARLDGAASAYRWHMDEHKNPPDLGIPMPAVADCTWCRQIARARVAALDESEARIAALAESWEKEATGGRKKAIAAARLSGEPLQHFIEYEEALERCAKELRALAAQPTREPKEKR